MGSRGFHSPAVHLHPPLAYLIVFALLWVSAHAFEQRGSCAVEVCWDKYEMARDDVETRFQASTDSESQCAALRTYWGCIRDLKTESSGCQGDIRYYSVRNGVKNQLKNYNCTLTGPTIEPSGSKTRPPMVPAVCLYHGRRVYRHCGLFGDPHLRTFYDQFQTCKVKGAWPLVNNEYLTVQVTNDPVMGNTEATATSKLTVIVKGNPECSSKDFQMYQAQTNNLPESFDDGHTSYGPYKSVELMVLEPGKHVEIHIRYIETVISVRQIGRYFAFAMKMPEDIVNQTSAGNDLELCARGCPSSERIDYQDYLAKKKHTPPSDGKHGDAPVMARSTAESLCRAANLVDFYFDSCVFDLMATGDRNFTLSAFSSFQDLMKLHPFAKRTLANRTSLETYDELYGSSSAWRASGLLVWLTLFFSVLCSR